MRQTGKSPIAKCKDRIQKLLTQVVRLRDSGCIFRSYPKTGRCSTITAADHIISRQIASTYGLITNVICACWCHHKFFKEKNPTIYSAIVEDYIGKKAYRKIHELAENSQPKSISEWLKVEEELKKELEKWQIINLKSSGSEASF